MDCRGAGNRTRGADSVISPDLERKLAVFYKCTTAVVKDGLPVPEKEFIALVNKRLCEEVSARLWHKEYADYGQHWLDDYIDAETHYALVNSGFDWSGERFERAGEILDDASYRHIRNVVCYAFVERAGEFINNLCAGGEDNSSLLCSLKPWVRKVEKDRRARGLIENAELEDSVLLEEVLSN